MKYNITSTGGGNYQLTDEQDDCLGTMWHPAMRPYQATIKLADGSVFQLSRAGFWQMNIAVTKNDIPFAEIKPVLGQGLAITFSNGIYPYRFRRKSVWQNTYALLDPNEYEVALVYSNYLWKKWTFEYEIEITTPLHDMELNLLIPLLLAYCARYMRLRSS